MEEIVRNILELLKIKSISGNQPEIDLVLDWVKNHYIGKGAYIHEYNFDNASPAILLSNQDTFDFDIITIGHLDVVPAKDELFNPEVRDGKIFGRGTWDMKSAVAVNLKSLEYSMNKDIKFGVLITTDEETTSNGMKALAKENKITAKVVFDTDAGSLYNLVEKYKHPVSVKILASGDNAHSSTPWQGLNAINGLINCIKEMEKSFPQYDKNQDHPQSTWIDTMTLTAINSPTTYNVVPNEANAWLNFRLTEKTSLEQLEKLLRDATKKNNCKYEILLSSRGVYMDKQNPIIQQYMKVAAKVIGKEIIVSHTCGATDSRMFADNSTIIMHGLNGDNAHGDNEYVEIDSIHKLIEIEQNFIDEYITKKGRF